MFDIVGMGNAIVDLTTLAAENQAFANMHISNRGGFFRTRIDEFEEILHFSKIIRFLPAGRWQIQ